MIFFLCVIALDLEMNLRRKKDHTQISQDIKDPYNNALLKDLFQSKFKQHTFCSVLTSLLLAGGCEYCLKSLRSLHLSSYQHCKNVHYLPGQQKDILQKLISYNAGTSTPLDH